VMDLGAKGEHVQRGRPEAIADDFQPLGGARVEIDCVIPVLERDLQVSRGEPAEGGGGSNVGMVLSPTRGRLVVMGGAAPKSSYTFWPFAAAPPKMFRSKGLIA